MKKVITYGTYDLLHYGHIRFLERAKALGDYLIVGVTADDFDKMRGKINVQQSLMQRVEAVRATGIADEIIIEEYEGQKIDDIRRLNVDIFTVGSDWVGKFDYLNEFCEVVYLPRTKGISSSDIRAEKRDIKMGLVGNSTVIEKFFNECAYVNGIHISGVCCDELESLPESLRTLDIVTENYNELLRAVDAVYLVTPPKVHYNQIKAALMSYKHVICESPVTLNQQQCNELFEIAKNENLVLVEGNKTAYSTAYERLILQIKSGKIGQVVSVDAVCTSLSDAYFLKNPSADQVWGSMESWGSKALLPIYQILGTAYLSKNIVTMYDEQQNQFDIFTKISFVYQNAVASIKVGKGVKSESELIITGTKGYAFVPAPWWKTEYFEFRYENPLENKRYFYQLEGEGIRYELVAFAKAVESKKPIFQIEKKISAEIAKTMEDYYNGISVKIILNETKAK